MTFLARYFAFSALLLALVAVAMFAPALSGDFVLDDGFNILQNRLLYVDVFSVESLRNAAFSFHDGVGGRPLPMLSFALDYWRAGSMDAAAFKTTNLFIHGATVFFLALCLRRLLLLAEWAPPQAALGALVFALAWGVHPLQVSSVMYVVQRMQTMETLFLVLALWAYLSMRQIQIAGTGRGRAQGLAVLFFWLLALGCKEDAPLLFVFCLALELTVLRFRAARQDVAKGWRQTYTLLIVLGLLVYFFVVVPHYWSWDAYGGRNFSSLERLMTQARVLCLYLWQIVFPYPDHMTFIYDDLPVSRSLWAPWTTLPSLVAVIGLLVWAWCWRNVRPLFSLGVLLFFSGHFITSNVIALELVFEHRNHFPLIGAVLAVGDLLMVIWQRLSLGKFAAAASLCAGLAALGIATLSHAYTWGDPVRHAEKLVELLPGSTRAWTQLGGAHFDLYKATGEKVHLENAVDANEAGLQQVQASPLASNLVIYKTLLGTVEDDDWQRFFTVLREVPPSWQDKFVVWTMMNNVDRGFAIEAGKVVQAIAILVHKVPLSANECLRVAVFVYKHGQQDEALPYFIRFAQRSSSSSASFQRMLGELEDAGLAEWSDMMRSAQAGNAQ